MDSVRLSAVEFWTQWLTAALWFGNGYVLVLNRDASGAPKPPLYQIHPDKITIHEGRYYIGEFEMEEGQIIHLRGEPPYLDGLGQGVITRYGADLGLAMTTRTYAAAQYSSGVPAGYLQSTAPNMDQAAADKLKAKWMENHGSSARSIAVLNATTSFVPVQISPMDAQLDSARQWGLRDVAMAFGLPGYMLGVSGDSETYANAESRIIELRMFSLLPWMRRIESTLDSEFPRGTELKILSGGLERADTKTRYDAYKTAIDSGWLTKDEVRAMEDRPPLPEEAKPAAPAVAPPAAEVAGGPKTLAAVPYAGQPQDAPHTEEVVA